MRVGICRQRHDAESGAQWGWCGSAWLGNGISRRCSSRAGEHSTACHGVESKHQSRAQRDAT